MKIFLATLALPLLFSATALAKPEPFPIPGFEHRNVEISVPDQYSPGQRWPVIVSLHGYSATGVQQAAYLGLTSRVSREGFILVMPNGTKDSSNKQFWNAWSSCCNRDGTNVDDVSFIEAILKTVSQNYSVDVQRRYLIGHSNGAFMAYRFACERPGAVAAVIGLAGTMGPEACRAPGRSTHIVHMHGTADETIYYDGGSITGSSPRYFGAMETAQTWAGINSCVDAPVDGEDYDLLYGDGFEGPETHVKKWTGCHNNATVELWTLNNAPHVPNIFVAERPFTKALLKKTLSLRAPR